jgi:acetaldehyde dehydrogenase (acetylating)
VAKAASDILIGKSFDHGVLCSSPNSVVVDAVIADEAKRQFQAQGGYFLTTAEADVLAKALVTPQRLPNPKFVGQSAVNIAKTLGFSVPDGTRALIAELKGVGRDYPLSIEKLCPVLSYYVVADWQEGCERCKEILRYGGMGHTMSIHSTNDQIILEFGLKKPAFRICVNTPTTHGSIGLSTGLDPAMTLGCGGFGGNITSDNITPRHLINIKRVAYELRPVRPFDPAGARSGQADSSSVRPGRLPQGPQTPQSAGIQASAVSAQVENLLAGRVGVPQPPSPAAAPTVVRFVCEEDVRQALALGRTILIDDRTIVTPLARDLGEARKVLITAGLTR